jgi:hypothetical protein
MSLYFLKTGGDFFIHWIFSFSNKIQTHTHICLWNVGTKRKHKNQTKGIWEEGTKRIYGPTKEKDGTWRIKSN